MLCVPRARGSCRSTRWANKIDYTITQTNQRLQYSHDSDKPFSCKCRIKQMLGTSKIHRQCTTDGTRNETDWGTHDPPPEQDVDPGDNRKVHVCLDFVRHVGPETSPHDNVPAPPVGFFKRFPDARSDRCEHLVVVPSMSTSRLCCVAMTANRRRRSETITKKVDEIPMTACHLHVRHPDRCTWIQVHHIFVLLAMSWAGLWKLPLPHSTALQGSMTPQGYLSCKRVALHRRVWTQRYAAIHFFSAGVGE